MNKIIMVAAMSALVAACGQPAAEVDEVDSSAAVEAEAVEVMAADGQPAPGTYRVTSSEGVVATEVLNADGTYTETTDGEVTDTGRWNQKSPEEYCYTSDAEGSEEICNSETVDENGVWTSTGSDGLTATVERVEA